MKIISFVALLLFVNTTFAQVNRVDKLLDSCIKKNFNGAVLIAKNGKIEYLKYTGIANRHYDMKYGLV